MFKIGEFSKLTQVSIRMLRYYDEMGLLKPDKVDPFTDYRLYSAEQIPRLNRIRFLRDLGFGISEIAEGLCRWEDGTIEEMLEKKRRETEEDIKNAQEKLNRIDLAKRDIAEDKIAIHCSTSINHIPACPVFSLRKTVKDYYCEGQLWKEMAGYMETHSVSAVAGLKTFTIYHDAGYKEQNIDMEVCLPVRELGKSEEGFQFRVVEEAPFMACSMVQGPFENIAGAYLALAGWLSKHSQFEMEGDSRQSVHRGPWNEADPDKYLTEIQIPLKKRSRWRKEIAALGQE